MTRSVTKNLPKATFLFCFLKPVCVRKAGAIKVVIAMNASSLSSIHLDSKACKPLQARNGSLEYK